MIKLQYFLAGKKWKRDNTETCWFPYVPPFYVIQSLNAQITYTRKFNAWSLNLMHMHFGNSLLLKCGANVDLVHDESRMRTDEKLLIISFSHPFYVGYLCSTCNYHILCCFFLQTTMVVGRNRCHISLPHHNDSFTKVGIHSPLIFQSYGSWLLL